jgi:hypothetical protein
MHGRLRRTFTQVQQMCMCELEVALDDDAEKRRAPEGVTAMNPAQMVEHMRRRKAMTLAEKIAAAREVR